jgi:Tfp pilus assembly protein PilO
MRRFLVPLILVLIAGAMFVFYTDPTYQASKALNEQVSAYDDALNKSKELLDLRTQLVSKRNTFSPEDLARLQRMLPDNVDNIRLIIDINSIAARHGLALSDVQLGDISDSSKARSDLAVGASGDVVGSVTLGFSLSASYDDLLIFLQDLEHSLRVIDVEDLSFDVSDTGKNNYTFTVRTYWLH